MFPSPSRFAAVLALAGAVASCSDFTGPAADPVPDGSHFRLAYSGDAVGTVDAAGEPVGALGRFSSYAYADGAAGRPEQPVFVGGFDVRSETEGRTAVMYLTRGDAGRYDLRSGCLGSQGARCATLELMLDWNPSNDWTEETRSSQVYQLAEGEVVVTRVDGGRIRGTVKGVAFAADRAARSLDRARRLEVGGTFNVPFQR